MSAGAVRTADAHDANYLAVHQYMPYERMVEHVRDVYGAPISVGTLVAMVKRGGKRVLPAVEEIKRQLQRAAVVSVDETGCHVRGKLKWVHGAATERLTLLGVNDHRGVDGIKALGVLDEMTGIVIHDAWPAYWNAGFEKVSGQRTPPPLQQHRRSQSTPLRLLAWPTLWRASASAIGFGSGTTSAPPMSTGCRPR